jgi:hypothetical protein
MTLVRPRVDKNGLSYNIIQELVIAKTATTGRPDFAFSVASFIVTALRRLSIHSLPINTTTDTEQIISTLTFSVFLATKYTFVAVHCVIVNV